MPKKKWLCYVIIEGSDLQQTPLTIRSSWVSRTRPRSRVFMPGISPNEENEGMENHHFHRCFMIYDDDLPIKLGFFHCWLNAGRWAPSRPVSWSFPQPLLWTDLARYSAPTPTSLQQLICLAVVRWYDEIPNYYGK